MTAVDFRCEQCGQLVSIEAEPGQEIGCPHCQAVVVVPAALANLPRPQVPGGPKSATVVGVPALKDEAATAPAKDAPAEGEDEEQEEEFVPSASAGKITALMPWVLSLFLHLGVGLILAFAGMMYVSTKANDLDEIEMPGENFVGKNANTGTIQPAALGVTQAAANTETQINTGVATKGEAIIRANVGQGVGLTATIGGSMGGGDARMNVGNTLGRPGGGKVTFLGSSSSNIHHLVFVIDRSGSMEIGESGGNLLKQVKFQMRATIRQLKEVQDFHIIFFSAGEPQELDSRALIPATEANKNRAADFLENISGAGKTDPIPALRRAVAVLARANANKGKQIFLLTDGDFPDNEAVLNFVKKECVGTDTRANIFINTYLFGASGDRTNTGIIDTMKEVARVTGGNFKILALE